ncbi:MAG: nfi [Candidatus Peribacteria bacterium]|nr:nfi [Candidatus Peribacteria bacterium]
MNIRTLHEWNLPPREAVALQKTLAASINVLNAVDVAGCRLVAGVDVSSNKFDPVLTAGIIVWDRRTGQVVDQSFVQEKSTFPYTPGLLSFREIPVLTNAISHLQTVPHAILVDGHGIAHPRRLGIAAHLGLLVDVPTVGVAKSRLTGIFAEPGVKAGSISPLLDADEQIGVALRLKDNVQPVLVSPGNHINMASAVELVIACARGYKLPEPTRLAHLYVNAMRVGTGTPGAQASLFA